MTRVPAGFTGLLLTPDDEGYHEARRVWNGMHDRRPALIARCRTAEDVSVMVRHAADLGLGATVRGGGHNVAGAAVADGTLMIDLSPMRRVTVDAEAGTAEADGGCLLRDVDLATAPYGLACPAGVVSHTGLGGLALGGGYGWLARKWGPTCDHILALQVVLADGEIVECSPEQHPELFWALRGGGGGFGVVTRFTLRLRPVAPMFYRSALCGLDRAEAALRAYREFAPGQPDDLHVVGSLKIAGRAETVPAALRGEPVLALNALFTGAPEDGPAAVAGLFDRVPAALSTDRLIGFAELQALADTSEPHGHRYYTKSAYLTDLSPDTVPGLLASAADQPSPLGSIDFEYLRGAISRGPADSAFPGRDAPYICTFSAHWTDRAHDEPNIAWARASLARTAGDRFGGAYSNYLQDEPGDALRATYGEERYRRLAVVRSTYDPKGLFRGGANTAAPGSRA
ncbi:FAD-binding oxidoreductase [Streptomyces sp. NPDC059740]|uniref:FAD-binding oxidoreductase n=1 Tax=Streptomyces sp. NPDC059740 TaxID=3346926 RepID=UPI00364A7D68